MEIRNPFILFIGIIVIIFFLLITKKKKTECTNSSKIANTKYIKKNEYYQKKLKKYKILILSIKCLCLFTILISILILSRIARIDSISTTEYNRDIYLCMDISDSVNSLNLEIVQNMKDVVESLKGERFGISIFNSTSVILVPLTDDYNYVLTTLNKLEEAIETRVNKNYVYDYNSPEAQKIYDGYTYLFSGTTGGDRGSSLIGDGLASCVYSFPKLEEENRTRIIVFSTDNELAGDPLVTLAQAAEISKKKNVVVYGIGTDFMSSSDQLEFKNAVEKTGGELYVQGSSSVKSIVANIEKQTKNLTEKENQIYEIDLPQIPFVLLLISFVGLVIIENKVIS